MAFSVSIPRFDYWDQRRRISGRLRRKFCADLGWPWLVVISEPSGIDHIIHPRERRALLDQALDPPPSPIRCEDTMIVPGGLLVGMEANQ